MMLSSIITTSAASIAASEPMRPIAMPMSERISTGASFMPSPVNASCPPFPAAFSASSSSSTLLTLSAGSSSAQNVSSPISFATASATSRLSPVSITVFLTPSFLSFAMASAVVSFISSAMMIYPINLPSSARNMTVPAASELMDAIFAFAALTSTPAVSMSFSLPAYIVFESMTAFMP